MIKIRNHGNYRRGTLALAAAVLCGVTALSVSQAQAQDAFQQVCIDNWADAPANPYCPGANIARRDSGHCHVESVDCSITVTVGSGNDTMEQTFSRNVGFTLSPDRTDDVDLCFRASAATPVYVMAVKVPCGSGDIDSGTAATDGLPALESGFEKENGQ